MTLRFTATCCVLTLFLSALFYIPGYSDAQQIPGLDTVMDKIQQFPSVFMEAPQKILGMMKMQAPQQAPAKAASEASTG
ncbi:hypothetical protein V5799_007756 [Amblyomma americanum]|uniref:Secreted protein n=1 Tax=Amblyomma americanum TaxID=6943 RepID=A0AAQ4FF71_AMBAM